MTMPSFLFATHMIILNCATLQHSLYERFTSPLPILLKIIITKRQNNSARNDEHSSESGPVVTRDVTLPMTPGGHVCWTK